MLTFQPWLFTSYLTSYFHLQPEPAILAMGAHTMKNQRAVKGPTFYRTSLQTPGKSLNFQCLDVNLKVKMKEKNVLVVRRETFTRGKTPSCG